MSDIECIPHMFHINDMLAIILWVFVDNFDKTYSNGLFLIILNVFQVVVIKIVDGFIATFSVLTLIKIQILLAFEEGCRLIGERVATCRDHLFKIWVVNCRENEFHGGVHLIPHLKQDHQLAKQDEVHDILADIRVVYAPVLQIGHIIFPIANIVVGQKQRVTI